MTQEEFERYEHQGDFPPKEPREPFEEMLNLSHEPQAPLLKGLHIPKEPLTKEGLKTFLIELKPIVREIMQMSRRDQHLAGQKIQDVKNLIHASDLSKEILPAYEKIAEHFSDLLTHSTPLDQEAAIAKIESLQLKL